MHKEFPRIIDRQDIIAVVTHSDRILEIGPFTNPIFRGANVKYFDVMEKNDLIKRAEKIGYPSSDATDIDFVSPNGDLSIVNEKFDVCFSSHCLEHQPDLIRHLLQVETLLNTDGIYLLVIPDKRYCFDHFIPETTISDVIDGLGRTKHTIGNVIRHRALVTHNDPNRHWLGDHGFPLGYDNLKYFENAIAEFKRDQSIYIDVHAWQFTPNSFQRVMKIAEHLKLTNLKCRRVYATPYGSLEFCAVLQLEST